MTQSSRWFRKPDWALAVVFAALVMPYALQDTGFGIIDSYDDEPFRYRPGMLMLMYIVLEGVRKRHPLTGAVVGAFTLALAMLALMVRSAVKQDSRWALDPGSMLAAAATGAVLGAVIGSIGWLVEWLVRRPASTPPEQRPPPARARPSGEVVLAAVALVLCLTAESVGWAVQSGVGFREWLSYYIIRRWPASDAVWTMVVTLVQLDRFVVVAVASLATYAMLRRWRAARGLIVGWGLVALLLATARVLFFQRLGLDGDLLGAGGVSEYTLVNLYIPEPAVPIPVFFDIMRLEVPIRAALCVVGLPYVLLSKRLKEYLGSVGPGQSQQPGSGQSVE